MEADAAFAHRPHPDKKPRKALKYKALWEQAEKDTTYWEAAHAEALTRILSSGFRLAEALENGRTTNRYIRWLYVVALIEAVVIVLGRLA